MLKKVYNFVPDNTISNEQIIYMTMKFFWKNLSVAIAAMSLIAACSDKDDLGSNTNGIPKRGVMQNIVERSEFSNYIDWQTYAGDDFYRYATGAWQDVTITQPGKSTGTLQEQGRLSEEYISKVCQEGTIPAFDRIFKAFSKDDMSKNVQILLNKLRDIENDVTNEDEAWKKMAELMKEGYTAPLDYGVWPVRRKVYPALISNKNFGHTDKDIVGIFIKDQDECATAVRTGQMFAKLGQEVDVAKWAPEGRCATGREEEYVVIGCNTGGTRAAGLPAGSPTRKIFEALGGSDEEGMAAFAGYEAFDEEFQKLTVKELKGLLKYAVIDRDTKFIGAKNASALLESVVESYHNPLSLILNRHYSETQVPAENKARVTELSELCRKAFAARLENSPWLSSEGKAKAKDKLQKMWIFIGWPSSWEENATVKVSSDESMSAYQLVCDLYKQRASVFVPAFKGKTDVDHIMQTMMMSKPTYEANAVYNTVNNCVYIYASNLIPPIYDPSKSDAYNFAVMGATTIGHEMTHGFDTGGSKYDATGNKKSLFSGQDNSVFLTKAGQMTDHFGNFVYGGGIKVDGVKTVGENIADLGGLNNAYDALMGRIGGQADERLYKAREYFRAFALGWMEKGDNEYMQQTYDTPINVHAPNLVRVNGNVYQVDAFYDAFGITGGQLYIEPDERLHIW